MKPPSGTIATSEPRLRTQWFDLCFIEGFLIWAKKDGTPSTEDWDTALPFFKKYAPKAAGWLSVIQGGALTSTQRTQAVEWLVQARCRYASLTVAPETRGSLTAMNWASANEDIKKVAMTFGPDELDQAFEFIGAGTKKRILMMRLRMLVTEMNVDPGGRLLAKLL